MMTQKKQIECVSDAEIRRQMMEANYAGDWRLVQTLSAKLNEHHKSCYKCQGLELYQLLPAWKNAKVAA